MTAVCAVMTVCITGCGEKEETVTPDVVAIEAKLPEQGDLVLTNEFIGSILPQEEVYVVSMVSAEVLENYVSVGDTVSEGEVLCKMDDEAARLTLENANAAYDSAKAGIAQAQGAATELQDIQTQSGIDSLESQIASTQKTLTDTNNDLKETAEDLEDAKEASESAQNAANSAAKRYKTAATIAAKWAGIQQADPTYAGKSLTEGAMKAQEIIMTYEASQSTSSGGSSEQAGTEQEKTETDSEAQSEDETDDAGETQYTVSTGIQPPSTYTPEDYAMAKTVVSLAKQMASAKISEASLTENGLKALAEAAANAQSAVVSAATAEAQLEMQRKSYQRGIESAQEGLDTLQDNLETAKQTAEISQGQAREEQNAVYDAQLNSASIGIKSAQMQLDMYTLTSPIAGTVEAVNVSEHGFASAGNPAYIISNKDSMTTTFSVSEGVRNTLLLGQKITVDKNGSLYDGTITEISPMVNAQTGLFTVKANVSANGEELLTGTKVKIIADTYNEKDTLLIPYDAVYYDSGQAYVYCVENGYARRVNVETGLFDDTNISIISGIASDTQVITTWSAGLKDGAQVTIKENNEAAQ